MRTKTAILAILILLSASIAHAEPFDTNHRLYLGLGAHSFFPDDDEHDGMRPNQDGQVSDAEFAYIFDEGYDVSDFNGFTLELGYEYLFFKWFGLSTDLGFYGGEKGYDFKIEGIEAQTDISISVWHIDLTPRFHWQTRWTDLYGGPVVGLYGGNVRFDINVDYMGQTFSENDKNSDSSIGWGVNMGFELRIIKNFGVAIEDRLMTSVLFNNQDRGEWFNAGGNVLMLLGVVHL